MSTLRLLGPSLKNRNSRCRRHRKSSRRKHLHSCRIHWLHNRRCPGHRCVRSDHNPTADVVDVDVGENVDDEDFSVLLRTTDNRWLLMTRQGRHLPVRRWPAVDCSKVVDVAIDSCSHCVDWDYHTWCSHRHRCRWCSPDEPGEALAHSKWLDFSPTNCNQLLRCFDPARPTGKTILLPHLQTDVDDSAPTNTTAAKMLTDAFVSEIQWQMRDEQWTMLSRALQKVIQLTVG